MAEWQNLRVGINGSPKMGVEEARMRISASVLLDQASLAETQGHEARTVKLGRRALELLEASYEPLERTGIPLWRHGDGTSWLAGQAMESLSGADGSSDRARRDTVVTLMEKFPDAVNGEFVASIDQFPLSQFVRRVADRLTVERVKSGLKEEIDERGILALGMGELATARALGVVPVGGIS